MKIESIIKVTQDGDILIPSDMEIGSKLKDMVIELRSNGWRTFNHHDNWIKNEHYPNPTHTQQLSTNSAYNEMLKMKR